MCHQEKSKPRIRKTDAGKNSQNKGYTTAKKKKKKNSFRLEEEIRECWENAPIKKK